ncbi:MFS transporter [uncultured Adlercreutzia sp.]|uniref:MFS transporter n=1 Tax=uncultured Adlercreutzia sp. TaxID=875803 RepID=UPI0025D4E032|nr:MFS transporter [uncultured Adlercreutzia sp.]MCI9262470.1 MFS transporter [Eggerthellaceae bacterium]
MNKRQVIPMLAVLYGSAFVASFNENTINVALISIMNEFSIGANTAQWLVTGYMIVTAIVVTTTAFLFKRLKLRTLYLSAAGFLGAGLIVDMFMPTWPLFLVFRLVQAVGTGLFIPLMMSTVLAVAPHEKTGTYLSIGSCMITFGPALAPVVSGVMVTTFGWRSVLVPPAAVIVLLAIAGVFFMRNIDEPEPVKLDLPSVVLSAAGLFFFVFGLSLIASETLLALGTIVVGLAAMAVFVIRQHRISNPLLNLGPLHNSLFAPVCALMVVAMMTTFSMSVLLPLYFEGALGATALAAGALLLAPILVNAVTALVGGKVMDTKGCWPLLPAGFGLIAVGQAAVCLCATQLSLIGVLLASVAVYAGVGLILSPSQAAGLQTLLPHQHPHGVAILNTFIQIAASIGPSLFIGVLSAVAANVQAEGTTAAVAQADGFAAAVAVACAIAVIGTVIAYLYARKRRALALEAVAEDAVADAELRAVDAIE